MGELLGHTAPAPRGLNPGPLVGGNPPNGRRARDFYETPAEVTEALLAHQFDTIRMAAAASLRPVWELACGGGAMVDVLPRPDRAAARKAQLALALEAGA